MPSEPWSTLTPSATTSCGATEFTSFFGITVQTITTGSTTVKRDVFSQIVDGQIEIVAIPTKNSACTLISKKNTDITTTLIGTYIDTIKEGATAITVTDFSIYSDKKSTSTLPLSLSISSAISFFFSYVTCQGIAAVSKKKAVVAVTAL